MKHLPYAVLCVAAAACLGGAAGWPWGLPLGTVFALLAAGARIAARDRSEIGDDIVTIFCRHCDGDPARPCTCVAPCGRRSCLRLVEQQWHTTLLDDRKTGAVLAAWREGDSK